MMNFRYIAEKQISYRMHIIKNMGEAHIFLTRWRVNPHKKRKNRSELNHVIARGGMIPPFPFKLSVTEDNDDTEPGLIIKISCEKKKNSKSCQVTKDGLVVWFNCRITLFMNFHYIDKKNNDFVHLTGINVLILWRPSTNLLLNMQYPLNDIRLMTIKIWQKMQATSGKY